MPQLALKPTHKEVREYYESLAEFAKLGVKHETAVRSAFQQLLEHCARQCDLKLVPEYAIKRKGQAKIKFRPEFVMQGLPESLNRLGCHAL